MKEPTNGELAIMLGNISGKIEEMHQTTIREDIAGRVSDLEFWRKAIIWGSGAIISISLFVGSTVYSMIVKDVTFKMETAIDRKLTIAFDDLVIEEIE
jgi:hypothetical protein